MFVLNRVHEMAPQHPEWRNASANAVLTNDMAGIAKFCKRDWAKIVFLTHSGMSQAAFLEIVRQ